MRRGAVMLFVLLHAADLRAAQTLTYVGAGADIYCLFSLSCTVSPTVYLFPFTVPGTTGQAILEARTFAGVTFGYRLIFGLISFHSNRAVMSAVVSNVCGSSFCPGTVFAGVPLGITICVDSCCGLS